jgi:hypothetical protein
MNSVESGSWTHLFTRIFSALPHSPPAPTPSKTVSAGTRSPPSSITHHVADLDTLVLQALLSRIEDQKLDLTEAMNDLDGKAKELKALREFKNRVDDATLGKEASDAVDHLAIVLKDDAPVMVEVGGNTTLGIEVREGKADKDAFAEVTSVLQRRLSDEQGKAWREPTTRERWLEGPLIYDKKRDADKAADVQRVKESTEKRLNAITEAIDEQDRAKRALRPDNRDGQVQTTVKMSILGMAKSFDIQLGDAKTVSALQKLVEQINNIISEVSTDAQKFQTIAQDKHQQLTQLVNEASRMTRIRHEGRLTTSNRVA